jgi:hypothetical protein
MASANAVHSGRTDGEQIEELAALDERDVKALTQYLTVLDSIGRVQDADDLYLVVSQSGSEYMVDTHNGVCECPDSRYRNVRCKHLRRVAFATGDRPIPASVDREAIDPNLGAHVEGEPVFAGADETDKSSD